MPVYSEFTVEQFITFMVECIDGADEPATKKKNIVELAGEFNSKIIESFTKNKINSSYDLMEGENIEDPFLIQLRQAFVRSSLDAIFCAQFSCLLKLSNLSLIARPDMGSYSTIYGFYHYESNELSKMQMGKDSWVGDLSFMSRQKAKQKPLGKTGIAKVPTGWMRSMDPGYWESDAGGAVEYLDSAAKKQFKMRRISDSEPGLLYRYRDIDSYGVPKPTPAGSYLFALSKGFGLIAASYLEINYLQHSTFLAGQPALLTGNLIVDKTGKITEMDCSSGHYAPEDEALFYSAIKLFERSFITAECNLRAFSDDVVGVKQISVRDFLTLDLKNVTSPIIAHELTRWREENPEKFIELKDSTPKSTLV